MRDIVTRAMQRDYDVVERVMRAMPLLPR